MKSFNRPEEGHLMFCLFYLDRNCPWICTLFLIYEIKEVLWRNNGTPSFFKHILLHKNTYNEKQLYSLFYSIDIRTSVLSGVKIPPLVSDNFLTIIPNYKYYTNKSNIYLYNDIISAERCLPQGHMHCDKYVTVTVYRKWMSNSLLHIILRVSTQLCTLVKTTVHI